MMRRAVWILGSLAILIACGRGERRPEASARDLITIRTMGLAYLEENNLSAAEEEFTKLTQLAPDEPLGYANLGLVYLRLARYPEAEEQITKARELDPDDSEIRLLLAKVMELTDRSDWARRELSDAIQSDPNNVKATYALAQLYGDMEDPAARTRRAELLARVVELAPANVPARLQLVEVLLRNALADSAARQLEEIRRQVPDLPIQSTEFFDRALTAMRAGAADDALTPALMFHNVLRVTSVYQAGLDKVVGPGGALVGLPLVTFSQVFSLQQRTQEEILAAISFTDATAVVGLDTLRPSGSPSEHLALAVGDYDGDGDQDVFLSVGGAGHLFRNEGAGFTDVASAAGVTEAAGTRAAIFADYDNDSDLDLILTGVGADRLYRNEGDGTFREVGVAAKLADTGEGRAAVFVDADHDGDLDLLLAANGVNRLYRNNLDGTFIEMAGRWGLAGGPLDSRDVAFFDFDGDDDIDLFVVNADGSNALYGNLRGGRFEDVTASAGLATTGGSAAVAVGDYDNDGFFDLFIAGNAGGEHVLYRARSDGAFERDTRPQVMLQALAGFVAHAVEFFDFDNDGWLDLVVAGRSEIGSGVLLFRNAGPGNFADVSSLLPEGIPDAVALAIADYDGDGDLDVFVVHAAGRLQLLRNDGGNVNRFVKVRLVGLTRGSGKNNYFGIGAKLEMRAGQMYQSRVATGPVTHFGLGQRLKADVLRIMWTNGVPQNLFYPGSDQDLLEEQVLKGSCAFLYTWNGERYEFVTDVMWRSALGMPTGIMSGQRRAYAPPHASQEYVRIPGDLLRARDGVYTLQITEELWEVAYLDEVKLLVVDHPSEVDIFVNERFVPPAPVSLDIHQVHQRRLPIAATDDRGANVLDAIAAQDYVYVSNLTPARYQGITELHDLVLDFGDLSGADEVQLYLQGWIFPTDASINVAMSQSSEHEVVAPLLQVRDGRGRWQTVITDLGFPSGKSKTVIADLTGKFLSGDHRVRIRTNMEIYWDHAFVAIGTSGRSSTITTLSPAGADLHARGFSRTYRKGGRFGPHWFDYQDVSTEPRWRPIEGAYTRFGDVGALLQRSDDRYVIMAPGDEMTVTFDAAAAPDLPPGWSRDFLIYTDGWIKDADLNTATGSTVEPLPFHAMSAYPYGSGEAYPRDAASNRFVGKLNTRIVTRRD